MFGDDASRRKSVLKRHSKSVGYGMNVIAFRNTAKTIIELEIIQPKQFCYINVFVVALWPL